MLLGIIIVLFITLTIILFNRKKAKKFITGTLSEDEQRIVGIIRDEEVVIQKKISQLAGFSKSKMSKLVRRLEEKGVLKKRPFFKSNKLSLSKRLK